MNLALSVTRAFGVSPACQNNLRSDWFWYYELSSHPIHLPAISQGGEFQKEIV